MTDTPAGKTLSRVLFIAGMDGWSIALFAGFCAVISLLFGEWIGAAIGLLITAAGVLELRGRKQLMRAEVAGLSALIGAQLLILFTILLYSLGNLLAYDEAALLAQITPDLRSLLSQAGMSVADLQPLMKPVYFSLYLTVMGVTTLFQGGLALYYRSRKAKIISALAARQPALSPQVGPQT